MIEIKLKSGEYTYEQLHDILSKEFKSDVDIDLFITAMQETNQLIEIEPRRFRTKTEPGKKILKRPMFVPAYPSSSASDYEKPRKVFTMLYGGKANVEYPRIGIRGGEEWTRANGFPDVIRITSYYDRLRGWVKIPEAPEVKVIPGRKGNKYEAWRAAIPMSIIKKYHLKLDTPIGIQIESFIQQLYVILRLWGYVVLCMVTFGETKDRTNPRSIELIGRDFVYETNKDIRNKMEKATNQILNLMARWLKAFNKEYFALLMRCDKDGTVGISIPISGTSPEPVKNRTEKISIIELIDPNRLIGAIIGRAETKYPVTYIPKLSEFKTVIDDINKHLEAVRGKTKLIQEVLKNVGRFR